MSEIKLKQIWHVAPDELKVNENNVKYFAPPETETLRQLIMDIKKRGILVPLIAKKDGTLLAGHSRLIAAKRLKLKTVPVQYVESKITENQETEFVIKDNLLRRQMSFEERKQLYAKLIPNFKERIIHDGRSGAGVTSAEAAEITGINKKTAQYDLSFIKHQARAEAIAKCEIEVTNEKALYTYKRSIQRMLNVAIIEKEITVKKFLEITKTALERLNNIMDNFGGK